MADRRYAGGWDPSYRNFEDESSIPSSEDEKSSRRDLEIILDQIMNLRRDLSAEIVIQEEKSHWEEVAYKGTPVGGERGDSYTTYRDEKIIDLLRIAKPDTEKREAAKAELQKIYEREEFYLARYAAGTALGISKEQLRQKFGFFAPLRLYSFKHPAAAFSGGIAAAGAAVGLGVYLLKFFEK